MLPWQKDVANRVLNLIKCANHAKQPYTLDEWQEICARYNLHLFIVDGKVTGNACRLDDILVVKAREIEWETHKRIAHEVAEYLLSSDWEPPYNYPDPGPSIEEDRHQMARKVEQYWNGGRQSISLEQEADPYTREPFFDADPDDYSEL